MKPRNLSVVGYKEGDTVRGSALGIKNTNRYTLFRIVRCSSCNKLRWLPACLPAGTLCSRCVRSHHANKIDLEQARSLIKQGRIFGSLGKIERDGDRIQCHLCGGWYILSAAHIWQSHGIQADDYRELFGLNRSQGLTGTAEHRRRSVRGTILYNEKAHEYIVPIPFNHNKSAQEIVKGRPQRVQSYQNMCDTHPAHYITTTCIICGVTIRSPLGKKRVTCSPEHLLEAKRRRMIGNTQFSEFWDNASEEQKSLRGDRISRSQRRLHPRITKTCVVCGAAYAVIPSRAPKSATCGKDNCKRENARQNSTGRQHTAEAKSKVSAAKYKYWQQRKLHNEQRVQEDDHGNT